jgi:hypothetical protein
MSPEARSSRRDRTESSCPDTGSEFRGPDFRAAVARLGVEHHRIRAGRPTSNGHFERLQLTILDECWRPAFARSLVPKITALSQDLDDYLHYYNTDCAHTGRLTRSRIPADIVYGAAKWEPPDERLSPPLGIAQPSRTASARPSVGEVSGECAHRAESSALYEAARTARHRRCWSDSTAVA